MNKLVEGVKLSDIYKSVVSMCEKEKPKLVEKLTKNENNKLLSEVYHGPRIRVWNMEI